MGVSGLAKTFAVELARRWDNWQNAMTALGTGRDKRMAGAFFADVVLQPQDLENLYHGDDMAARCVGKLVEEALRKGIELHSTDDEDAGKAKDEIAQVQQALDDLGWLDALAEGDEWGRLFGGGAILIGADGAGDPGLPLDDNRVKAVRFLTTLDRRDLQPVRWYDDPLSPKYGQPETFRIVPITSASSMVTAKIQLVHETRLILFGGARTSKRKMRENGGWSHSVLQRIYEVLRDANANWAGASHLMTDASQAVYKVAGLLDMLASADGGAADMATRMTLVEQGRSVARAIVVDKDGEDFERKTTSFAGLPDMLDRTWQRLAAAADMPVTKLMGMSPAGLNATGQSDENTWYDSVAAHQAKVLKRPAQRIARLVARSLGLDPASIDVCFPPLKQLSPLEQADLRLKTAQTDASNVDKGIYLAEEITIARSKGGKFSADEPVADLDVRRRALDAELQKLEDDAGKPDEPPPQFMAQGGTVQGDPPAQDGPIPAPPTEKQDHIEKRGSKYVLLSKTTGQVLGEHDTREQAEEQEQAILAHKGK